MIMQKHVTVIGALYIGMGVLLILAAIIVAVTLLGAGWITLTSGEDLPFWILLTVTLVTGFFLLLFAVPQIVAGIGLLNLKPWSRYLAMVLAVFGLFNIPVGTAIGIYTLWALVQDEVEQLFSSRVEAVHGAEAPESSTVVE
jgi:hypothetical protein